MCPVSQADGHDTPRHLDQPVPVEATVPDDVVVSSEHPVGQPVVAHAGAIVPAGGAIRHAAPAAAEDRGPRGRVENQGNAPPAQRLS